MERTPIYIATQTEKGFRVVFEGNEKKSVEVSFDDFTDFANKYNDHIKTGKKLELSEKDKLILSLWQMLLIPDTTIH